VVIRLHVLLIMQGLLFCLLQAWGQTRGLFAGIEVCLLCISHRLQRKKADMHLGWCEHRPAIASASAFAAVCVKCQSCTTLACAANCQQRHSMMVHLSITYTLCPALVQNLMELSLLECARYSFVLSGSTSCLHCMHTLARGLKTHRRHELM